MKTYKTFAELREGWFDKKEKEDPDYEELKKLGACFGQSGEYERPME